MLIKNDIDYWDSKWKIRHETASESQNREIRDKVKDTRISIDEDEIAEMMKSEIEASLKEMRDKYSSMRSKEQISILCSTISVNNKCL